MPVAASSFPRDLGSPPRSNLLGDKDGWEFIGLLARSSQQKFARAVSGGAGPEICRNGMVWAHSATENKGKNAKMGITSASRDQRKWPKRPLWPAPGDGRNQPWVAAVWPLLPEGKPIDHPDLA